MHFLIFTKLQITKFTYNENLKILTNFASWKSRKDDPYQRTIARLFFANRDKSFRGNQVYEWLWKGAHSFEDMTNVSKQTRTMLE
jgi:hypothetical protein